MVFDMILSSRGVVVLGFAAQELISIGELKRALYACLKIRSSVTLRIHTVDPIEICDTRTAWQKLYGCRASRSSHVRLEAGDLPLVVHSYCTTRLS